MKKVMELVTAVRTRRSEMNVPPSKKAHLYIETSDPAPFEAEREAIAKLAYCSGVEIGESFAAMEGSVTVVTAACRGYLPMEDLVDKMAETARLKKELEGAQKQLATRRGQAAKREIYGQGPSKRHRRRPGTTPKSSGRRSAGSRNPWRPWAEEGICLAFPGGMCYNPPSSPRQLTGEVGDHRGAGCGRRMPSVWAVPFARRCPFCCPGGAGGFDVECTGGK